MLSRRETLRLSAFTLALAFLPVVATAAEAQKILVIGGSGMIGQRVVREALSRGHEVTLIARDPDKVTERHERLRVAQGDVLDSKNMAELAAGKDAIVSAVGTARAQDPDYTLYRRAAESLVTALRSLGDRAPRLIVVGGVGSLGDGAGGLILDRVPEDRRPEHLGQKAALDFYRTVDDVRWTYVSPPARIMPGERTGKYEIGKDELVRDGTGESRISMEDYAVALIDELETPRHVGRRFTVGYGAR